MLDGIINIRWQVDRSMEPMQYKLVCTDTDNPHPELEVSISSDEVPERVARARLIEKMFAKARECKIDPSILRFTVNGTDE